MFLLYLVTFILWTTGILCLIPVILKIILNLLHTDIFIQFLSDMLVNYICSIT